MSACFSCDCLFRCWLCFSKCAFSDTSVDSCTAESDFSLVRFRCAFFWPHAIKDLFLAPSVTFLFVCASNIFGTSEWI